MKEIIDVWVMSQTKAEFIIKWNTFKVALDTRFTDYFGGALPNELMPAVISELIEAGYKIASMPAVVKLLTPPGGEHFPNWEIYFNKL